jgi:hypothetical protein
MTTTTSQPPAADADSPGGPIPPLHIVQLTAFADNSRVRAQRAGLIHAHYRHELAAAHLRVRYPLAAAIEADLSDEFAQPQITRILGADGAVIHDVEFADDIPEEVPEALCFAVDFADTTTAGWAPVAEDSTVHRLTFPTPPYGPDTGQNTGTRDAAGEMEPGR